MSPTYAVYVQVHVPYTSAVMACFAVGLVSTFEYVLAVITMKPACSYTALLPTPPPSPPLPGLLAGVRSPPQAWKRWCMARLDPYHSKSTKMDTESSLGKTFTEKDGMDACICRWNSLNCIVKSHHNILGGPWPILFRKL